VAVLILAEDDRVLETKTDECATSRKQAPSNKWNMYTFMIRNIGKHGTGYPRGSYKTRTQTQTLKSPYEQHCLHGDDKCYKNTQIIEHHRTDDDDDDSSLYCLWHLLLLKNIHTY
jgi:hypothetical protein